MVNTITNLIPKILARALLVLREQCAMPRLVNSDYGIEGAKKGTTIDVPIAATVGTTSVTGSSTPKAPTDLVPGNVQITMDKWFQNNPIGLTDKEMCDIDAKENFLPLHFKEAIRALANLVNADILSKYKGELRGVYGFISSPSDGLGTILDPFAGTGTADTSGVAAAVNARKVLLQQLCPKSNRRGVLNFNADAAAITLTAFSDAEKIMSATVKIEGEIGRKYGIDWFGDDEVPSHTVGTAYQAGSNITVNGVEAAGSVTIDIRDSDNDGGTILRGDIITIAGDSQTYVIIGDASYAIGTGATEVGIYPALKVETGGSEVIKLKNSHTVNLVFHRDAFALAMRPLNDPLIDGLGSKLLTMQDPHTGLVMRLEVSRQHKQTIWEFDILWGCDLVHPELAMRIAGAA